MIFQPHPLDWSRASHEIGIRLAAIRRAQRITQCDLADAAGITRSQIQHIEYGRGITPTEPSNPKIRTLYLIARSLGVPPILLFPHPELVIHDERPQALHIVTRDLELMLEQTVVELEVPISTRISQRLRPHPEDDG